tara:strand:+ start:3419 stop:4489 length:1071 start_codon:yes stop_codon:yes gene_type:complete
MELAMQFSAAERGIAPAVLACFFSHSPCMEVDSDDKAGQWDAYDRPKQKVDACALDNNEPRGIRSLMTINQISTFSLDDLMVEIRRAPVQSRRDHLVSVMKTVCKSVFKKIRQLSSVHKGYAMVKLNMTPASVVFCPELRANSEGNWTLDGSGYMPISDSYLDGVPFIVDYNSMFTTRVRESSHSFETAYAMACMVLVAFSRAQHGTAVSDVLWQHLTDDSDPSGFVESIRSISARSTNTSAFLACIAANADMRELPEVSKALSGVVSDMDVIVRESIVNSDGSMRRSDTPVFTKLVSLVTGSSDVDTRIFSSPFESTALQGIDDQVEAENLSALNTVKQLRLERLAAAEHSSGMV